MGEFIRLGSNEIGLNKAIMKSKIHVSISLALMKLSKLKEFLELINGVNKCRHIN